jgi:hypothetical protein
MQGGELLRNAVCLFKFGDGMNNTDRKNDICGIKIRMGDISRDLYVKTI